MIIAGLLLVLALLLFVIARQLVHIRKTLAERGEPLLRGAAATPGASMDDEPRPAPADVATEPGARADDEAETEVLGVEAAEPGSAIDDATPLEAPTPATELAPDWTPAPEPDAAVDEASPDATVPVEEEVADAAEEQVAVTDATSYEPYQGDGRWWFERDGELLVYDEQRGEWTAAEPVGEAQGIRAEEAEATPSTPSTTVPAADTEAVVAEPGVHPLDEPRPEEPSVTLPYDEPVLEDTAVAGSDITSDETAAAATSSEPQPSFWKCPSCGVVNGSTAMTCRMCFTARP